MPTIAARAGDVTRTLKEQGVADDETVFVSFGQDEDRRPLREAIEEMRSAAEKADLTDQDIMDLLEIPEEEFENIFGHPPQK